MRAPSSPDHVASRPVPLHPVPGAAPRFAPDATVRRLVVEPAVSFGAGRALLLQVAHPAVGQGVADHSDFQRDPFTRLFGTLEAVVAVVFGERALAEDMGRAISRVHDRVTGPSYRANDIENLAWVQATLTDSALWGLERLLGPLPALTADAFCADMAEVGSVFGCPVDAQPTTRRDLDAYVAEQIAGFPGGEVHRRLAADIVRPRLTPLLGVPLTPALALHGLIATGAAGPELRAVLDLGWDRRRQRRVDRVLDTAGAVMRRTPRTLRTASSSLQNRWLLARARRHLGR